MISQKLLIFLLAELIIASLLHAGEIDDDLLEACTGNIAIPWAERLLTQGANPDTQDDKGRTPLMYAAKKVNIEAALMLLSNGASVNQKDKYGRTALMFAAMASRPEQVALLNAGSGKPTNAKDSKAGVSDEPAWEDIQVAFAKLLVNHGAEVSMRDNYGHSAIDHATHFISYRNMRYKDFSGEYKYKDVPKFQKHPNPKLVSYLVRAGAPFPDDVSRLLFVAAKAGFTEDVEKILTTGIEVDSTDNEGLTPLMYAATEGKPETVTLLLKHDADPNAQDKTGFTPLMYAASWFDGGTGYYRFLSSMAEDSPFLRAGTRGAGDANTVEELLSHGADLNVSTKEGVTALMLAVAEGNTAMVEKLLIGGADVNALDRNGRTALFWAAMSCCKLKSIESGQRWSKAWRPPPPYPKCPQGYGRRSREKLALEHLQPYIENAIMLINGGANVDAKDNEGNTPLIWSIKKSLNEIADALIEAGADVGAQNNAGRNALMIATTKGDLKTVKTLLAHKPNLRLTDKVGNTALHLAAEYCQTEIVEVLLSKSERVKLDAKNNEGRTPLMVAALLGHTPTVELLKKAGAKE